MTFLLVFLAIAVLGLAAVFGIGRLRPGSANSMPAAAGGLPEPDPRLPPVLLPEHPVAGDVSRVRFSVALRGYRMDQVDTVLDRFAEALEERDARIRTLEAADRSNLPDGEGN
ncbi:DivIVA domain-containing protein [Arthrobacter sp. zg-Y1110]|uniref:DivIVA domain-containing protein n=1 Tax=Arthrobacter sp. zg-Y1110 TaxID=2886932 RepID=UPI001D1558C9|nr:DivIVA domain-containing protein [Arthrobacter sp. zg-Y1110]MCC3290387.1 DivIVA domain-containing protein [Arthrobacter sp. zg-Y1110]UWX84240.1 DivIVA domain-containing protein [Arthrobacter sp. zg-Y1110]